MSAWRHNQAKHQWELGYEDEPRQKFIVVSWVTDEFIHRASPRMAAVSLHDRLGTVPPPLAAHLPPPPPVVVAFGLPGASQ